jgi:5-methyltetrahydropteroyltriglutamate--homocysteine methyltransferase
MTELVATTPGLYPLPDWAKDELAELKGHQKGDLIGGDERAEIVDAYGRARADVVDAQVEAGLDRVVEGQLRWDDMLAHPLTINDAVETGGIVRYYDNNNFYRDPQVRDELVPSGDVAAELDAVGADIEDDLQTVLPGPYSLADLATDDHYGDEADFLDAVADLLEGELDAFPAHETLFLLEPSLVEAPPDDDAAAHASEAIDRVAAATDAEVVVHTYWGAVPEKTYAHLMDATVDAIGFDFVADADASLYNINEYGTKDRIAMGLVDGGNTLVESVETVRDRVEWVDERTHTDFERVYLTSNTELFYLPTNRFEAKLEALGDAAALAEVDA